MMCSLEEERYDEDGTEVSEEELGEEYVPSYSSRLLSDALE